MKDSYDDERLIEWEKRQHVAITGDPLWRLNCYREALYLVDAIGDDIRALGNSNSRAPADEQLLTSVASIAATIAEGYGRPSMPDRMRFLSYSLGSAREAIVWYKRLRPSENIDRINDRLTRLARVRRMLIALLTRLKERGGRKFDPW
jgi:four helix bundle protein